MNQIKESDKYSVAEFTIKVFSEMQPKELEEAIKKFNPTDGKILLNNKIKQMNVLDVAEVNLVKVEEIREDN